MIHFDIDENFFNKNFDKVVGLKTSKISTVLARIHIHDITVELLKTKKQWFSPTINPASTNELEIEYQIMTEDMKNGYTRVEKIEEWECTLNRIVTEMSKLLGSRFKLYVVSFETGKSAKSDIAYQDLVEYVLDKTSDKVVIHREKVEAKLEEITRNILLFEITEGNQDNPQLLQLINSEVAQFEDNTVYDSQRRPK